MTTLPPPLSYRSKTLDITYEVVFKTPFFALPRMSIEVWETFYKHLAPKYIVQSSDFHAIGGTVLSQARAIFSLFRGNATIEVSADKFEARFKNANHPDDPAIIEDCVTRFVSALTTLVPESQLGVEHFTVHSNLDVGSPQARAALLEKFRVSSMARTEGSYPGLHLDIENTSENWVVSAQMSRTWGDQNSVFFALHVYFHTGASATVIPQRAATVKEQVAKLLENVGLAPA